MALTRAQKDQVVESVQDLLESSESIVVTQYAGLSVSDLTALRSQLREHGGRYLVAKNRLVKRAIQGTQFEGVADLFAGPTGIVASPDPVSAAKVAHGFAKENDNLVILGGGMGAQVLDASGVEALAKMPSLDELRGKLVGLLQAPATQLARLLQAPAQQMVGVTKAQGETG